MDCRHGWFPAVLRILGIILVLHGLLVPANNAQFNLPLQAIGKMAETFGQTVYEFASEVTALTDLRSDYLLMDLDIRSIDGHKLVKDMKYAIQKLLARKIHAIQKLERLSELAYKHHSFDPDIQISYPESKKRNVSEFELVRNEHFNNISVNLTMSTVHIPTNIYEQSTEVLNGIAWSNTLDETFRKNFEADQTLTWQYFCSSTGFFRLYPGTVWHRDRPVSSSPTSSTAVFASGTSTPPLRRKDVVVLVDSSAGMKGQNFETAKEMAKLIIDTLTDNDFFNVITFSDVPEYLDPCSNGTLVHANTANKRRFINAFDQSKATGSANHELALTEAFELLAVMNLTSRGTLCHQTILLLTDGVRETYDEMFLKYNSPVMVRVFTYKIGNDNSFKAANMKDIACNNKGYFSHIRSPLNIHKYLHDFIRVLSRPLVLSRPNHTHWTNVYDDTVGLDLVFTVSRPVFSIRSSSSTPGKFLGVVGTDVKLSEVEDIFKQFMLGVDSYSFIITNNGYVVSHPDLRPKYKNVLNPNHDVVELWKLEPSVKVHELTRRMLNRESGHMRMSSHVMFDSMKRVRSKDNHYFFTDIHDTPFSLAISLPIPLRGNLTESKLQLRDFELSALRSSEAVIAPWNYCRLTSHEQMQNPLDVLMKYLNHGKSGHSVYKERCNNELINSFLFDTEATRGAYSSWMKENWEENADEIAALKDTGVELVFIGTKGGLTRYMTIVKNLSDPDFIENHRSTIDALYYTRAVENGEEMFTFSLPFDAGTGYGNSEAVKNIDLNKLLLTASTPIFINKDSHEAVTAVVGLQIKYTKFRDLFMNGSQFCSADAEACRPCVKEEIDCYLLDFNGYVVFSEDPKELGQFYGELDGFASVIMKDLTINESNTQSSVKRGIFRRFQIDDHQGVCEILKKTNSGTHSAFVNPFRLLFQFVIWLTHELSLLLLQFNFGVFSSYSVDSSSNTTDASEVNLDSSLYADNEGFDSDSFNSLIGNLLKVASIEQVYKWKDECVRKTPDGNLAVSCLKDILKLYEPGVIGYKPCIKSYTHYAASPMQLPQVDTLLTCDVCGKSYSINLVPRTNLMLLAVDSVCYCNSEAAMSTKPIEVNYNESAICQTVQEGSHRHRPTPCYAHHKDENTDDCGDAGLLYPSRILHLLLLSASVVSVC